MAFIWNLQSFMRVTTACLTIIASMFLWLLNTPSVQAQAFFDSNRQFTISQACNATTSIRNGTNPIPLTIGKGYTALGENKRPNGTHAFIVVGDDRKWVSLSCGDYAGSGPDPVSDTEFLPFFDNKDNKRRVGVGGVVDITPPPPTLNVFDQEVVKVCGPLGKEVDKEEFESLMQRHPDVLKRIKEYVNGQDLPGGTMPMDDDLFLSALTNDWFGTAHGFDHIFCSEPNPGADSEIGGLHFHGRYLQLQEAGLAGILENNVGNEEVDPGTIYTLGVKMKYDDKLLKSEIKGYGLTLSAEDILKLATKAFRNNPTSSRESVGCLLDVEDDNKRFKAVFVRRNSGVRTFYPDATPNGGDRFNPPCNS